MRRRASSWLAPKRARALLALMVSMVAVAAMMAIQSASAADRTAAIQPYATQRGPDPTLAMIEANRGPFATAQVSVPAGNGFNGGVIYYPTDTSLGTWGAVAIVPGYTALFANEEAWMGPWLSSFGFVVIGIETNSRTDYDVARGQELLAALNYLTTQSPVRNEVDPTRLAVLGHSMGGGGAIYASEHQPSLKAAVELAPFSPSQNMSTDTVPSMVIGGQNDTVVTPSYLSGLYATVPASTQSDFAQIAGADHVYYTHANNVEMKLLIPWLKIFVDSDTRYTQFLCPTLPDPSTISEYQPKCPYVPSGGTTTTPTPPPPGACSATYSTVGSWSGGFQGQVTVAAGSAPVNDWSVHWTLASGQTITQVWSGVLSSSGPQATVSNASYNGSIPAGGSTTFGFLANGTPSTPTLTCTSP